MPEPMFCPSCQSEFTVQHGETCPPYSVVHAEHVHLHPITGQVATPVYSNE